MAEEFSASAKVYPTAEHGKFSILDMLDYFEKHGAMLIKQDKIDPLEAKMCANDLNPHISPRSSQRAQRCL